MWLPDRTVIFTHSSSKSCEIDYEVFPNASETL